MRYQRHTHARVIVFGPSTRSPGTLDCAIDRGILNRAWRAKTEWSPVRLREADIWDSKDILVDYEHRLERIESIYQADIENAKNKKEKDKVDKFYLESLARYTEALEILKEEQ